MTLQGISNFIQGGVSQAAAWGGFVGTALYNATSSMPARVASATAEVFSAGPVQTLLPIGMYCVVSEVADLTRATRTRRTGVAAIYLTAASLFYLSQGASWHFWFLASGAMGAFDPLRFGPRLNGRLFPMGGAPLVPVVPVAPSVPIPPEDAIPSLD